MRPTRRHRFALLLAVPLCLLPATGGPALAQPGDPVAQINEALARTPREKRSDLVLLPLAAKMQPVPGALTAAPDLAVMMTDSHPAWPSVASWAAGEPQQAVLRALDEVTREEDPRLAHAFALPYGPEGVPIELIRAGLYIELGDPPMLAAADFKYMTALTNLGLLVHAEATRRSSEGDPAGAIDLLIDWCFLCRQMADRPMFIESLWGLHRAGNALMRVRDIAYQDFKGARAITSEQFRQIVRRLDDRRGYLGIERLAFPTGQRAAAEQLIARVFVPRAGVNADEFPVTMARLASTERPLRLFGEAGRWQGAGVGHANWFDTTAELEKVYGDWSGRWPLPPFDPRMNQPFAYDALDRSRFAVLAQVLPPMGELFARRQVLRTESVGTRTSLAVLGYFYDQKQFPPQLAATRPRYISPDLDADPFNPNRARGAQPPMEFFVPIRDTRDQFGEREDPRPHEIKLFVEAGPNFNVRLGSDEFVVYSVGADGAKNWAREVQNSPALLPGRDYLVWPPLVSLARQYLKDAGQLE